MLGRKGRGIGGGGLEATLAPKPSLVGGVADLIRGDQETDSIPIPHRVRGVSRSGGADSTASTVITSIDVVSPRGERTITGLDIGGVAWPPLYNHHLARDCEEWGESKEAEKKEFFHG